MALFNASIAALGANSAYVYLNKIAIPKTLDAFMKSDKQTQVAFGGLAGE